jgi:hypothetical protein
MIWNLHTVSRRILVFPCWICSAGQSNLTAIMEFHCLRTWILSLPSSTQSNPCAQLSITPWSGGVLSRVLDIGNRRRWMISQFPIPTFLPLIIQFPVPTAYESWCSTAGPDNSCPPGNRTTIIRYVQPVTLSITTLLSQLPRPVIIEA